jgi:hypothetical protein
MAFLYKGTLSAGGTLAGPLETTMDEWGNTIVTATFVKQGNALATLADAFDGFDEMASSWDILSRNGTYDIGTGLTTIQETYVTSYASSTIRRYSLEAQSGKEAITSHPNFEDIAGTPDNPNLTNAVWVTANDAAKTMRFVELKGSLKGLEQYISGSGALLKEQWIDVWSNIQFEADLGKIRYPDGSGIWGGATGWLLVGVTAEPFGSRYKVTYTYRQASAIASRGGGWSTTFYA